jgi:hypothetical protein
VSLNIALDFDGTYTADPTAWNEFIELMQRQGHNVYCVTMRAESEGRAVRQALAGKVDGFFFTDRKAKQPYMFERGININIWIDDQPSFVVVDALPREQETT